MNVLRRFTCWASGHQDITIERADDTYDLYRCHYCGASSVRGRYEHHHPVDSWEMGAIIKSLREEDARKLAIAERMR